MNNLKYLRVILETDYKNWPELYQNIDQILEELEELIFNEGILSIEIKNKIFWFFRNYFSNYKNLLSKIQAKKLYNILLIVLQKDPCLLNLNDSDLSILEDVLIILERIVYLYPELKGNVNVLNPLIKAATYKKELNTFKHAPVFIQEFLKCFKAFLPNEKLTRSIELIHLTQALQEFFDKQLVWNKHDPVALLVHGLLFLKDLRCKYKENSEIYTVIDHYAVKLCDMAIQDIPKTYPYYSINLIQEDVGSAYVKYLEVECRNFFDGLYKILCPEDVLPLVHIHTLAGDINLPDTHININHTELSSEQNNNMKNLINELHVELKGFLSSINIKCLNLDKINIRLNLFSDQKQFERYGYLVWNVDSSGGGICMPAINNQPTTAYVYQTDQGFQNLKHELTHAFMNNILGNNYAEYLSGAFTEGLADFFDKGPSNFYKLTQLQRLLLNEPLKTLPDIVTLNEGGSVVYLYGYFLIMYFFEEKLSIFSKILSEVQNKNQYQVIKLIEQSSFEQKDNFNNWIQNKLSQLIIHLFDAIRQQDKGNVNQLLAGMDKQRVNTQENSTNDTPLHVAIGLWTQYKNDTDSSKRADAIYIIWCLLLKGAELKSVKNAKGESPFDLIKDIYDQELIEKYAQDAKHYIDLESLSYTEKMPESVTC